MWDGAVSFSPILSVAGNYYLFIYYLLILLRRVVKAT